MISPMKCIIGLGNPGKKYEYTRHNMGFLMLDHIRESWKLAEWKDSQFKWIISEGLIDTEKVILLKPTTYMNLSGESILSLIHFYKLDPHRDILVISDDIDMEFSKVRYRKEWSHGGQNGLRDMIEKLGTQKFHRIKIGIGRDERYSVSDWVLSLFTKVEQKILQEGVFLQVEQKITNWIIEK